MSSYPLTGTVKRLVLTSACVLTFCAVSVIPSYAQTTSPPPADSTTQAGAPGTMTTEQTLSDEGQRNTIAFSALSFLSGTLGSDSFFPPGKVADFWGFQYMRDNDPSQKGHNTDFLTKAANNMLAVLNDSQEAKLIALAESQVDSINQYAYKRFLLMKAFRRQLEGDIPTGSTGLNEAAVKAFSAQLYHLDGEISFQRATVMGGILASLDATQRATLDALKGKGMLEWPDVSDQLDAQKYTHDVHVAVMTYAGDLFSWYLGSIEADVYFAPERQGTYFGSFYMKDAPAMGNPDYTISSTLTGESGQELLGLLTTEQAALLTGLVDLQRDSLQGIVDTREAVATELRKFIAGGTADSATVLGLMDHYGELDGEIVYLYATHFAQVGQSLTEAQQTQIDGMRDNIMGSFSTPPTGAFLYSNAIAMPEIPNTDFLFGVGTAPTETEMTTATPTDTGTTTTPPTDTGTTTPPATTGTGTTTTTPPTTETGTTPTTPPATETGTTPTTPPTTETGTTTPPTTETGTTTTTPPTTETGTTTTPPTTETGTTPTTLPTTETGTTPTTSPTTETGTTPSTPPATETGTTTTTPPATGTGTTTTPVTPETGTGTTTTTPPATETGTTPTIPPTTGTETPTTPPTTGTDTSTPATPTVPPVTPTPTPTPTTTGTSVATTVSDCTGSSNLSGTCNAGGKPITVTEVKASGHLANGVLNSTLTSEGWVSNITITATGKLVGGVVTGYIKNEGIIMDFVFKGASIIGGTLGGNIQNESAIKGFFKDVKLLPDTQITGGVLKGKIEGDKKSPALLTKLTIKAGSHLSGVKLGKGVKVEKGVVIEDTEDTTEPTTPTTPTVTLPTLGQATATDAKGKPVTTKTEMSGGISLDGKTFKPTGEAKQLSDSVDLTGRIQADPAHVKQKVKVFVTLTYQASKDSEEKFHFKLSGAGGLLPWTEGDLAGLQEDPFQKDVTLPATLDLTMYHGLLLATGVVNLTFGYLLEDGTAVQSPQPIELTVKE